MGLDAGSIYSGDRRLHGRTVGVMGLARTGAASVRFLADHGATVVALDSRPVDGLPPDSRDALSRAAFVAAPYGALSGLPPIDLMVVSPGVPTDVPLLCQARAAGVEVIGEVELAYRFCEAPICAVTGTCGKGTTVTSLGAMLSAAGIAGTVAGNIGLPLIGQMDRSAQLDVVVAEISSFQLETTVHFHPHIAVLLNITEDHLERYSDFEAYAEAKRLIFRNQTARDFAILCVDDERVAAMTDGLQARVLRVALDDPDANGHLEGGALVLQLPGREAVTVAHRERLALQGRHHLGNFLAAGLAALICGANPEQIGPALTTCKPAPHLMTPVATVDGVTFVDDSKATNPASAIADLSGISGPTIVIAGGKEKDTDFGEFGVALASRAKAVILIGECAARIEAAVGVATLCHRVETMQEAVQLAFGLAEPGDTVALCPACSSLDMFESYARRGEVFALAAQSLGERHF